MGRKEARDGAFKMLFQLDINNNATEQALEDYFKEYSYTKADEAYITDVVKGVFDNLEKIDKLLAEAAKSWTLNRISKVDKAVLRLAVYGNVLQRRYSGQHIGLRGGGACQGL